MANQRKTISNMSDVREQILQKFDTIENFSYKTGVDYRVCLLAITRNLKPDEEFLEACRINGIYVEVG